MVTKVPWVLPASPSVTIQSAVPHIYRNPKLITFFLSKS